MAFLLAALVGFVSPVQTGINARLRSRVGSPFSAALISFIVGAVFLLAVTPIIDHDLILLTDATRSAPWWIWFGGCLGPIFVAGTVLLLLLKLFLHRRIWVRKDPDRSQPWWVWTGGILGAVFVLGSVFCIQFLGVGMMLLAEIVGITVCGVLIDHFGLLGVGKNRITARALIGLAIMIAGAAMVKLV